MINHLVERGNLRDAAIGLIVGLAIAVLTTTPAHAQSAASSVSQWIGMAESVFSQGQSFTQQREMMEQQRQQRAANTPANEPCPAGYQHNVIVHPDGSRTRGACEPMAARR
jgi:hypothetical protein